MVEGSVGELGAFADAMGEDGGVEGWVGRIGEVVGVSETAAPVAEVGGDYEDVRCISDIGSEKLAEGGFGGGVGASDHDWDEGWVGGFGLIWVGELEESVDVGELHLAAMFGLVDRLGHLGEFNVPTLARFRG